MLILRCYLHFGCSFHTYAEARVNLRHGPCILICSHYELMCYSQTLRNRNGMVVSGSLEEREKSHC